MTRSFILVRCLLGLSALTILSGSNARAASELDQATAQKTCDQALQLANGGLSGDAKELYKSVLDADGPPEVKQCAIDGLTKLSPSTRTGLMRALGDVAAIGLLVGCLFLGLYLLRLMTVWVRWIGLAFLDRLGPVEVDTIEDGSREGDAAALAVGFRSAIREELGTLGVPAATPAGDLSEAVVSAAEASPLAQAAWAAKLFELARRVVLPPIGLKVTGTFRERPEYPEFGVTLVIENRRNRKTKIVESVWHADQLRVPQRAAWLIHARASKYPAPLNRIQPKWAAFQ